MYRRLSVILLLLALATPALAETFVRTGGQYELAKDQEIDGNFLAVGTPVGLSGSVTEDAVLIGNQVITTGYTGQDILTASVITKIGGEVGGDVRVVSADTTISGAIDGDLLVVAGSVDILSTATISGDVLLYAGAASVNGTVAGDVLGSVRNLSLNGAVGGSVDVSTQALTVGDMASVTESIRYTSSSLATQAIGATIGGGLLRNDPVSDIGGVTLMSITLPFFAIAFASFLWFFLSNRTLTTLAAKTTSNTVRSAITGTVALLVIPIIIFILCLSLVGVFVATICFFGYVTLILLAIAVAPALVGYGCSQLVSMVRTEQGVGPVMIVVGAVVICILLLLPVIGLYLLFFTFVITFGGLVEQLVRTAK